MQSELSEAVERSLAVLQPRRLGRDRLECADSKMCRHLRLI